MTKSLTPNQYAAEYEFRGDGGDYTPTDGERTMIEDAILGYLGQFDEPTSAERSAVGVTTEAAYREGYSDGRAHDETTCRHDGKCVDHGWENSNSRDHTSPPSLPAPDERLETAIAKFIEQYDFGIKTLAASEFRRALSAVKELGE